MRKDISIAARIVLVGGGADIGGKILCAPGGEPKAALICPQTMPLRACRLRFSVISAWMRMPPSGKSGLGLLHGNCGRQDPEMSAPELALGSRIASGAPATTAVRVILGQPGIERVDPDDQLRGLFPPRGVGEKRGHHFPGDRLAGGSHGILEIQESAHPRRKPRPFCILCSESPGTRRSERHHDVGLLRIIAWRTQRATSSVTLVESPVLQLDRCRDKRVWILESRTGKRWCYSTLTRVVPLKQRIGKK